MITLLIFMTILLPTCRGTDRPIIGILSQETSPPIARIYPGYESYIAASYVKAVQAAGARVVPIFINRTREYYRSMVTSLNGIILPGGNTWFNSSNGYADAGELLYSEAIEVNKNGTNFPILGICLGFELLFFLDIGRREYRTACWVKNTALHLDFRPDFKESKLFGNASEEIINILSTRNVTLNQHQFCVTEENMTTFGLTDKWKILSTNEDRENDVTFVSTVESRQYPFVGLQFHPEKNVFEWRPDQRNPHSPDAVKVSRFFFDWLVSEARVNNNSFQNESTEEESLIYNYHTTFTHNKLIYDEIYLFKNPDTMTVQVVSACPTTMKCNTCLTTFLLILTYLIIYMFT